MKQEFGVTLLELLIVVLIVGILATIAVPKYQGLQRKVQYTEAMQVCGEMYLAFEAYYMEYEKFPTTFNDLGVYPPEESIISRCSYSITSEQGYGVGGLVSTPSGSVRTGICYERESSTLPVKTQKLGIFWKSYTSGGPPGGQSTKTKQYWWREDVQGELGGGTLHVSNTGWVGLK